MTLQILVNHYNESDEIVKRFLNSLTLQTGVTFEVLIISDGGSSKISADTLTGYPFVIKYAYLPHSGVCHTRNILFQHATADYVMFCDIDDLFDRINGLSTMMEAAEKTKADIIGSCYRCETLHNGKLFYYPLKKDTLRVHGKIFKRQYLIDNNITYPDAMEISGDMAFLWLCYTLTKNFIWLDFDFYVWKFNETSVTRNLPYHHVRTFDKTMKCYTLLANEFIRRKRIDLYQMLIATLMATVYIDMTNPDWLKSPIEYQKNAYAAAVKTIERFYNDYIKLNEDLRKNKYQLMLEYTHGEGKAGKFENMIEWFEKQLKGG